eukprot:4912547-Pyramimonas_sp.AAC.1
MNEDDDPDDEEYVYVFEDDLWEVHEEADVTTALASYQAVRASLRDEKNRRGFHKGGKGSGKDKGGGYPSPPVARFGAST